MFDYLQKLHRGPHNEGRSLDQRSEFGNMSSYCAPPHVDPIVLDFPHCPFASIRLWNSSQSIMSWQRYLLLHTSNPLSESSFVYTSRGYTDIHLYRYRLVISMLMT